MADRIYKRMNEEQLSYLVNYLFTKLRNSPLATNTKYTLEKSASGEQLYLKDNTGATISTISDLITRTIVTAMIEAYGYLDQEAVDDRIDQKVVGLYSIKGSVTNFTDLPDNLTEDEAGYAYNVINDFIFGGVTFKGGTNVVWTGTAWDPLGGQAVDLSSYATTSWVSSGLEGKVDKVTGKSLSTEDYTTAEKSKLNDISANAEVNQNAFSNVMVGSDLATASTKTDTITLLGSNIDISISGKSITFSISSSDVTNALGFTPGTSSLILGESSSTAYRGDRGKVAYDHSQLTSGNPHNVTATDVGLGNVGNFKAVSTVANQGLTDTEKAAARANIGAGSSSTTGTVTSVATGAGLTGGTITGSGTIKANLKTETLSTLEASARGSTSGREYPVGLDKNGKLSVNVPWSAGTTTEATTAEINALFGS